MKNFILSLFFMILFVPSVSAEETADLSTLLRKSEASYANVKDYTALFYKKEITKEGMGEAEEIDLKFEKPFKIFMGWKNTHKKGLQVLYERGKHDNKLAIHKPGLVLGFMPVVFLPQDSPWVREGSESYDIEDAGIGTFLTDYSEAVAKAEKEGRLRVNFLGAYDANGVKGTQVETIFEGTEDDDVYFAYRIITVFDETSSLPVAMTLYDWKNELIGVYEYRDLSLNSGEDERFKKAINYHLYKVYKRDD